MAKVLVVTSGKGGVGKTTSTAALGAALAQTGQSVVVVDFDVGLRNLDLVMGAERRVVFDLINVVQGVAKLPQALIRDKRIETLWLLPASQTRDKDALTEEGVARVIKDLRAKFDWVICDSPAGIERGATLAMRFADAAVIVTNPEVSSVRDSDRIIGLLDSKTEKAEKGQRIDKHVLITRYDAQRAARCSISRTCSISSPRRCWASFRKARRCCAPPISARRSRSTMRQAPRRAPISMPLAGSRATTCRCPYPATAKVCSTSCSDGERHERLQPVPASRFRPGRARTASDPLVLRTGGARPVRPARHFARRNPDRAHQAYYGRPRERSGDHGSRRECLDARDRGRNPEFCRHAAGDRNVGGQVNRSAAKPALASATCSEALAQPARCRCGLRHRRFYLTNRSTRQRAPALLRPFVSDPFATARIFVIARPNFRRLCAGDYGTLCDIGSSWAE